MRAGLDIGSTTIKCVVLDDEERLVYHTYERHYSHIVEKAEEILTRVNDEIVHGQPLLLSISGSAGMGLAQSCGVPFVQEVYAAKVAADRAASILIEEKDLKPGMIADLIGRLIDDRPRVERMEKNAAAIGRTDAADVMCDIMGI